MPSHPEGHLASALSTLWDPERSPQTLDLIPPPPTPGQPAASAPRSGSPGAHPSSPLRPATPPPRVRVPGGARSPCLPASACPRPRPLRGPRARPAPARQHRERDAALGGGGRRKLPSALASQARLGRLRLRPRRAAVFKTRRGRGFVQRGGFASRSWELRAAEDPRLTAPSEEGTRGGGQRGAGGASAAGAGPDVRGWRPAPRISPRSHNNSRGGRSSPLPALAPPHWLGAPASSSMFTEIRLRPRRNSFKKETRPRAPAAPARRSPAAVAPVRPQAGALWSGGFRARLPPEGAPTPSPSSLDPGGPIAV